MTASPSLAAVSAVDADQVAATVTIQIPTENCAQAERAEQKADAPPSVRRKCAQLIKAYLKKFRGLKEQRPKRLPWQEYLWTFIGGWIGIAAVAFLHFRLVQPRQMSFLIGSFGASAAILFGAPHSPLAQPRNLLGGHLIGALCGCIIRLAIYQFEPSIGCATAVATTIVLTQFTETMHPPAGATALIAVTANPILPWANFQFILMPAMSGACTMLIVALIVNNLAPQRSYPTFWW